MSCGYNFADVLFGCPLMKSEIVLVKFTMQMANFYQFNFGRILRMVATRMWNLSPCGSIPALHWESPKP